MGTRLNPVRTLKTSILIGIVTVLSSVAGAQTLNLQGNQFTVTVPGTTFNSTETVSNAGTVSAVTGVPTSGTLTTPSFSFTLQGTGINSTSGTYTVGIVLDEQGSQRRLEILIPGVTLTFDAGGNLTGNLATPTVTIYGRDSAGTLTAEVTAGSGGSVAFNGNGISFSAADQIAFIQGQGGILADITTSIDNTGLTYDYTVILAATAGTNYTFEHSDGTDFPMTGPAEFSLLPGDNVAENLVLATDGQKLTGTVTFGAGGGGGGGGGGSTTCSDGEILVDGTCTDSEATTNAILEDIIVPTEGVTQETVDEVQDAVDQLNTLLSDNNEGIQSGDVPPDSALALINATTDGLALIGQASQGGGNTDPAVVSSTLSNISSTFNSIRLSGAMLTAAQRAEVDAQTTKAMTSTGQSYNSSTTLANVATLKTSVTDLVTRSRELTNTLSNTLRDSVRAQSQSALEQTLDDIAKTLDPNSTTSFTDLATTQQLLSTNRRLREAVIDNVGIPLSSTLPLDQSASSTAFQGDGLGSSSADSLASDLAQFVNPDGVSFTEDGTDTTAKDSLDEALSSLGTASSSINTNTNRVDLNVNGIDIPVNVADISIVPESIPDGISTTTRGNALVVQDGIATTVVPTPADPVSFASALNGLDADVTFERDGRVKIADNNGLNFSGTFAFDGLGSHSGSSSEVTFSEPEGDPSDPSYSFTVNYPDGSSQNLLPAVSNDNFYTSLSGFGLGADRDTNTGIINIEGTNIKPDYFCTPVTTAENTFRILNQDVNGIAYQSIDVNGDGALDYKVISGSCTQIVYGVP